MPRKECLVSGGAGFVGSHVVDGLIEQGHNVTIVDDLSNGRAENINKAAAFELLDIVDLDRLPAKNYDYIFHLAAKARVQPSIKDPVAWNEVNVKGTLKVLELAREVGAKVIFSSSSSVYGDADMPTNEAHPKNPKSPYALQKLIGEQYLKLYGDLHNLDYTILRYFNVYGERQIIGGAYSAVMGYFLDAKRQGKPLPIYNDGEQSRDFTYVKDVARANLMAMAWPRAVFNIGNGDSRTVNQIANMVGGEKEYIGEVIEPKATLADNSKARSMGWEPTKSVEDWIGENNSQL